MNESDGADRLEQEKDVDLLLVDSGDLHDGIFCLRSFACYIYNIRVYRNRSL
jgi:hypothetical protein